MNGQLWTTATASGSAENEVVDEYYVQCRIELARRHLDYKIIKNNVCLNLYCNTTITNQTTVQACIAGSS